MVMRVSVDQEKLQAALRALGLDEHTIRRLTSKGLRRAYHERSKDVHPDRFPDEQEKKAKTRDFQILLDHWRLLCVYAKDLWAAMRAAGEHIAKPRQAHEWTAEALSPDAQRVLAAVEEILATRNVGAMRILLELRKIAELHGALDASKKVGVEDIAAVLGTMTLPQLERAERFLLWNVAIKEHIRTRVIAPPSHAETPVSGGGEHGIAVRDNEEIISCPRCRGTGRMATYVPCQGCRATRNPTCAACKGKKRIPRTVTCTMCTGKKSIVVPRNSKSCGDCDGRGYVKEDGFETTCTACEGSGRFTPPLIFGTKLVPPAPWTIPTAPITSFVPPAPPRQRATPQVKRPPRPCPACRELIGYTDNTCPTCRGTGDEES